MSLNYATHIRRAQYLKHYLHLRPFGTFWRVKIYNTLSFKCHGFDLKYLFTIILKGQSPTVKVSERNIAIFETESNFNSVFRPAADSNGVTMEIKRKVEYDGAFSF